jgi:hypothetical protein
LEKIYKIETALSLRHSLRSAAGCS